MAQREAVKCPGSHSSAQREPRHMDLQPSALATPGPDCKREKGRGVPGGLVGVLVSLRGLHGGLLHPGFNAIQFNSIALITVLLGTLSCHPGSAIGVEVTGGSGELRSSCLTAAPGPLPWLFPLSGETLPPVHTHAHVYPC